MNLSLINFNLLNENLTYRMMEPLKRKGIRWLALNGGIRWVSLNEREKAVNERGGKEDKRRKKHSRGGTFGFWGESIILILGDCIGAFFFWGDWKTVLLVFGWRSWSWWTVTGGTCCWEFWARGPGILTESWS
jgi:hypothetical protein